MGAAPQGFRVEPAFGRRARIEFARTADGWDLALHHYVGTRADLPPVILCSGYACNRHFLDFDDRYSLARFLARRGFDTWILELRGHGLSEPAEPRRLSWTFDDFVQHDVPAAIAYVRDHADRLPVWIGHSMGGMVLYATLGQNQGVAASLAGLVTMASPVAFPPVASRMMRSLGQLLLAVPFPDRLPQHDALVLLWSMIGWSAGAAAVGMNPANMEPGVFTRALRLFMCNVPRAMLRQLAEWSLSGQFTSCDGRVDYRANLRRIAAPALIVAGAVDRLAPPETVRFAFDRISSESKRYREFGLHHGDSIDYGHVDLIFGRRAPEEVFATVADWIESATGKRGSPRRYGSGPPGEARP